MPLISLQLQNLRQFTNASFEFHSHRNLVYGGNAAGKSTVLEAVQLLSVGKSSRSKSLEKLALTGASGFSVSGECLVLGRSHSISNQLRDGERRVSIDGLPGGKNHETARLLPVSLISPDSHYEFQREARHRRGAIDWVLFHVEQNYQSVWSRYQRILQQRNAELKRATNQRAVAAWNEELVMHGDVIQQLRIDAIQRINPIFKQICAQLIPALNEVALKLKIGWKSEHGLESALIQDFDSDRRQGFTNSGSHRNDLNWVVEGQFDTSELSHGQRKLLFFALKLAQAMFLQKTCSLGCSLLVDDLSAELDATSQEAAIDLLSVFPGQVILTSIEPTPWVEKWSDFRSFHVKHGQVLASQNN